MYSGDVLRKSRIKKGLSLTQLEEVTGISRQQIAKYERGDAQITPDATIKFYRALDDLHILTEYIETCPVVSELISETGLNSATDNDAILLDQIIKVCERSILELTTLKDLRHELGSLFYAEHIEDVKAVMVRLKNAAMAGESLYGKRPI